MEITKGNWSYRLNRNNDGEYTEILTDFRNLEDHINIIAKLPDSNYSTDVYSHGIDEQRANVKAICQVPNMIQFIVETEKELSKKKDKLGLNMSILETSMLAECQSILESLK